MQRTRSVYVPTYGFLLGAGGLIACTASALMLVAEPVSPEWLALAALSAVGVGIAFSLRPGSTLSLDLAFLMALAAMAPPVLVILCSVPAAMFLTLADTARIRFRMRIVRFATALGQITALGAVAIAVFRFGSAWLVTLKEPLHVPALLPVAFAGMTGTLIVLRVVDATLRRRRVSTALRHSLLRVLPRDILAIPGALLIVVVTREAGHAAALLLVSLTLLAVILLRGLVLARRQLASANRAIRKRVDALQQLNSIGRSLATRRSPRETLETILTECRNVFDSDLSVALLFRQDDERAEEGVVTDANGPIRTLDARAARALADWAESGIEPIVIRDISRESLSGIPRDTLMSGRTRAAMHVPVTIDGQSSGLLSVQSSLPGRYDDDDLSLLKAVALQAAANVESARHYERAIRDILTGMYQRDYFFRRIEDEAERAGRYGSSFSVLMMDLDEFKSLNDRYGHIEGDRLLRTVGDVIRESLRAADIPCRYGGEEFAVLLPETDTAGARAIAERIRVAVAAIRLRHGTGIIRTTISIGVALHDERFGGDAQSLLDVADRALYAAKRAGRNRVIIAPSHRATGLSA